MRFGICMLSRIPVRAKREEQSEMVTELLFGDLFEFLETKKNWNRIRMEYDRYEGWIGNAGFTELTDEQYEEMILNHTVVSNTIFNPLIEDKTGKRISLLSGSSLPKPIRKRFVFPDQKFLSDSVVFEPVEKTPAQIVVAAAMRYLGAPYTWGGRNPFGIDCSGLVQMCFKQAGIRLPRDAGDQAQVGEALSFVEEAIPGDMAFFDDENGKIVHTGIICGEHQIIHASGLVRIDKIDHQGIFNLDTGTYSHKLRIIKRIL